MRQNIFWRTLVKYLREVAITTSTIFDCLNPIKVPALVSIKSFAQLTTNEYIKYILIEGATQLYICVISVLHIDVTTKLIFRF